MSRQLAAAAAAAEKLHIDAGSRREWDKCLLRDRPVFLMAEHIYSALVKHGPCREAN